MAADVVLARTKDGEGMRMKSDVPVTRIISSAHRQPIARCGSVPLGASSCTAPKPIAAKAKAA
jgi:hypothetical protein